MERFRRQNFVHTPIVPYKNILSLQNFFLFDKSGINGLQYQFIESSIKNEWTSLINVYIEDGLGFGSSCIIAEFMMNTDSCPLVANWSVYVPESIFR